MQKKQKKYEIAHREYILLSSRYVCKMVLNLERGDLDYQSSIHKKIIS